MMDAIWRRALLPAALGLAATVCPLAQADVASGLDALALKDYARARVEFEALPNDPHAIYHLSRMALNGHGEPVNPTRRFGLLQRAAALGHGRAKVELAWLLGTGRGATADPQAALKMLEEAHAEGNAEATVILGQIYHFAWWNQAQDWPRSASLLKKASDAGNELGSTRYATALILGQGVPADPKAGYELLKKISDNGFAEAQLELARVLTYGVGGLARDEPAGYSLYQGLARQGDAFAQYMTCVALMEGRGVARDLREASRWCDGAARQGDEWAQMRLGEMFRTGQGMPRVPSQAYYWFTIAANGTSSAAASARERRARIAQELSEGEIDRQTKRAAAFRPQRGFRVREASLPDLARGDRVTLGNVSITVPSLQGYFNNWEFFENLQRLAPNNPEITPNLLVLSHREDMDRFKMGLPGGIRSLEVARHTDDDVNVTPAIFADMRKVLMDGVDKARMSGRMKVDVPINDESALVVFREALNGGNGIDARAWVRINGRVLALWFTGFTHEHMQELRQLAPATVKDMIAQNTGGAFSVFGSNPN